MTTLNGKTNARSMNGLTDIYADNIISDNIVCDTATINNNLAIPNFPDVDNTLATIENNITGITYDPNTNTTTFAYPDVNGNGYNIYVPNANMIIDTGTLTLNNNFYVSQIDITTGMFMDNNAGITFASGSTGIIDQPAPYNGTNKLKATNFGDSIDVSGNITQSSPSSAGLVQSNANIISQTGTGTNILKATTLNGDLALNNDLYIYDKQTIKKPYIFSTDAGNHLKLDYQPSATNYTIFDCSFNTTGSAMGLYLPQRTYITNSLGVGDNLPLFFSGTSFSNSGCYMIYSSGSNAFTIFGNQNSSTINFTTKTAGGGLVTLDFNTTRFQIPTRTSIGGSVASAPLTAVNRTLNVCGTDGGINVIRNDNTSAPFIDLDTWNTAFSSNPYRATISGSTTTDEMIRFYFKVPSDYDIMYMRRTGTNLYTNLDVSGNITQSSPSSAGLVQSSTNIISQSGTGTNSLKATNFIGTIDVAGNITQSSPSSAGLVQSSTNIISQTGTGINLLKATQLTANNDLSFATGTGKIDQTNSTGTNLLKSTTFTGDIVANGTTAKLTNATTIGSVAQTTTLNNRAFNVIDGGAGIRLARTDPNNGAFLELINADITGTTSNNLVLVGGPTSTDNRFRLLFRTPTDLETFAVRRTQSNFYTPLDVSGNITQANANIISQTGTGDNLMKNIKLNTNNDLTLQGNGKINFEDGSSMIAYDERPVSDVDIHSYINNKTILTATFSVVDRYPDLYSAATANIARFTPIKLYKNQVITGIGFYPNSAGNYFLALYNKGASATRLAVTNVFNSTGLTARMNYVNFTATYTIPTTDIYYLGLLQTSASQSWLATGTGGNTYMNWNKTATNGTLNVRLQSYSTTTFPANIAAGQVFTTELFVPYLVVY